MGTIEKRGDKHRAVVRKRGFPVTRKTFINKTQAKIGYKM